MPGPDLHDIRPSGQSTLASATEVNNRPTTNSLVSVCGDIADMATPLLLPHDWGSSCTRSGAINHQTPPLQNEHYTYIIFTYKTILWAIRRFAGEGAPRGAGAKLSTLSPSVGEAPHAPTMLRLAHRFPGSGSSSQNSPPKPPIIVRNECGI